ncbi:hypothetical protein N7508_000933 [Penicillium antarcticum]|uniref:uncharacterized protein n=1 Tax=Penicillium antarcticum TaxID=416450 RepID=UPI00239E5BEA|nr:uncharacterized protein N7508_000933 [Penicillium antarcticum]KAJ5320650.1 hypothetical protein N7508_000933 [Penicillium antarcticum]
MQFRGNMQSLVLLLIGAMITQVSAMNLGGRPSTLSGCGNESLALGEDCAEGSNVKRSITDVSQYRPPEVEAIQWIKKWTVPNTRTASGNKWSTTSLPSALTVWNGYDSKIAPAAWAAAIVTRRSLSQGIFRLGLAKSWLNGMWGVQQNGVKTATDLAARAENIYQHVHPSESSYQAVLKNTLIVSGFPARSSVYKNVMRCIVTGQGKFVPANQLSSDCAGLVSTWLTRNHLVGLTLAINVKSDWLSKNLAEDIKPATKSNVIK